MAPPKVDLNGKEKSPEDTVPEAVVIDQSSEFSRATAQRQALKKRKRCKAAIIVLIIGIVIVAVALPIMIIMHKHHHNKYWGRWCGTDRAHQRIPENVHADYEKKLIFVNNTKHGDFITTHAIHDFMNKISAFRDPANKRCFIEPLKQTFDKGLDAWNRDDEDDDDDDDHHRGKHGKHGHHGKHTKMTKYYRTNPETDVDTARDHWGPEVAKHCAGHKFFMLTKLHSEPAHHIHISVKIVSVDHVRVIFLSHKPLLN